MEENIYTFIYIHIHRYIDISKEKEQLHHKRFQQQDFKEFATKMYSSFCVPPLHCEGFNLHTIDAEKLPHFAQMIQTGAFHFVVFFAQQWWFMFFFCECFFAAKGSCIKAEAPTSYESYDIFLS